MNIVISFLLTFFPKSLLVMYISSSLTEEKFLQGKIFRFPDEKRVRKYVGDHLIRK